MKKVLTVCLFSFSLAACAGNPPAWWNPGNKYSPENNSGTAATASTTAPAPSTGAHTQIPAEQSISVPEEDFEEMTLTPLQDEEGEDESGDASAQSVPEPQDTLPAPTILD